MPVINEPHQYTLIKTRTLKIYFFVCLFACLFVCLYSPVQPVECPECGRVFKNNKALNGHMRLHGGFDWTKKVNRQCKKNNKVSLTLFLSLSSPSPILTSQSNPLMPRTKTQSLNPPLPPSPPGTESGLTPIPGPVPVPSRPWWCSRTSPSQRPSRSAPRHLWKTQPATPRPIY